MKSQSTVHKLISIAMLAGLCLAGGCGTDRHTVVLDGFPTLQQSTDYTCGPASALAVMQYYQRADESESRLAEAMHTHVDSDSAGAQPGSAKKLCDYGTSIVELHRYFAARTDFAIVASSYRPSPSLLTDTAAVGIQAVGNATPTFSDYALAADFLREHLEAGRPVMVCWNLWGGHWTVCIGYDDRGTADFYDDDRLIMADPYDSTDGTADGRTEVSLVAFFYDWFCTMTPKPWQLQPYLVVAPASIRLKQ